MRPRTTNARALGSQAGSDRSSFDDFTSGSRANQENEEGSSFEEDSIPARASRSNSVGRTRNFPIVRALVDAPRPVSTRNKEDTVSAIEEHIQRMTLRDLHVSYHFLSPMYIHVCALFWSVTQACERRAILQSDEFLQLTLASPSVPILHPKAFIVL
jgi:hypothetical protein